MVLIFIYLIGDMMILFIKGVIIGIAKIIPGLSGAMLAVSFSIYDKLIYSITGFFDDVKNNFKFLLVVGSGILVSIVFFSNIVSYLMKNYYFMTMMLFVGFIVGGTFDFSKNNKYNFKNIFIILMIIVLMIFISLFKSNNDYIIQGNFLDYLVFFIGGVIEIFSSIVPGISGTAIFMLMGIYDNILFLFGNIFNFSFVMDNIMIYISYGMGMGFSFVIFSIIIAYLLKKYRNIFDTIILGFCISSIILLIMMTFSVKFSIFELFIGIFLFFFGVLISYLSPK